jgi:hypothetical protein
MSDDEKVRYVVDELVPMLKNDLRVIAESGCPEHGYGSGPNFTLALLCLVACETIGLLSAPAGTSAFAATRMFINRVGAVAGDRRYERLAGLLIAFFRNGIGHSFLPKQTPGLLGRTIWIQMCVDRMLDPASEAELHSLRIANHRVIRQYPDGRTFDVVTKILSVDVSRALDAFAEDLRHADPAALASFSLAFDGWLAENGGIRGRNQLTAGERIALDTPIEVF